MFTNCNYIKCTFLITLASIGHYSLLANEKVGGNELELVTIEEFFVTVPKMYTPATKKTIVEVVSTSKGIKFQFENYDESSDSKHKTTLDDEDILTSYNEVIIDFEGNGLRAYRFRVGRNGARQDAILIDDDEELIDWDGEWKSETKENSHNWETTIFIPWTITPIANDPANKRRIKYYLSRWDVAESKRYAYPAISRKDHDFIKTFASLDIELDFDAHDASVGFNFYPYYSFARETVNDSSDSKMGMDIFWQPSSNQQINASINPDFGQVESNDLVVNFSAIETFFSEKRPFFKENHELFDLRGPETLRLVHTPRIGSEPLLGEQKATDISYASRYTYYGSRFDFGFLNAFEQDNNFLNELGKASTNKGRQYYSTRGLFKSDAFNIGFLSTLTESKSIQRDALVSAVDVNVNLSEDLEINSQLIHTNVSTDNINDRSDNWWVSAEWEPSETWAHEIEYFDYKENMDVSDFGFVKRIDRKQFQYEVTRVWPEFSYIKGIRDLAMTVGTEIKNNHKKQDIPDQVSLQFEATLNNKASIVFENEIFTSGVDDILTRGNNPVANQAGFFSEFTYANDSNHTFNYEIAASLGSGTLDGFIWGAGLRPTYQFTQHLSVGLFADVEIEDNWLIWDEDADITEINNIQSYKRKELAFGLNAAYKPSNAHELRLKLESVALNSRFLATYNADESGYLTLLNPQSDDFSIAELAFQLRYRYQYSPKTEIYFVIGRGAEKEIDQRRLTLGELLNQSFGRPVEQTFLLKIKSSF